MGDCPLQRSTNMPGNTRVPVPWSPISLNLAGGVRVESNPAAGFGAGVLRYRQPTAVDTVGTDRGIAPNT